MLNRKLSVVGGGSLTIDAALFGLAPPLRQLYVKTLNTSDYEINPTSGTVSYLYILDVPAGNYLFVSASLTGVCQKLTCLDRFDAATPTCPTRPTRLGSRRQRSRAITSPTRRATWVEATTPASQFFRPSISLPLGLLRTPRALTDINCPAFRPLSSQTLSVTLSPKRLHR